MKSRNIRALASALILGSAVLSAIVGVAAVVAFGPRLPEPIAVHWGISGTVDRTDSLTSVVVTSALFAPLLAATIVIVFVAMTRQTVATLFARTLVGVGVFVGVFVGLLPLAFVAPQLDVEDAITVPVSAVALPLGMIFLVATAMGIGLSFVIPRVTTTSVASASAAASSPALDIAAGERAYWGQTAWPKAGVFAIFISAVLISTGALVVVGAPWWLVVAEVVVFGLLSTTLVWHVVVDVRGVRVIAALGFPRIVLPIGEVTGARSIPVDPLREFGGWGVRFAATGAWGVIVRKGDALEVARDGKAPFVVTVDDAETAARLVSGLAKQSPK
jgi:hypothetical protein